MRAVPVPALLAFVLAGAPLSLAFSQPDRAARSKLREHAATLMARARVACDLEAKGNPPFSFQGHVRLLEVEGGPLEGSYRRIWSSPEHWRTEIRLEDYHEIIVTFPDTVWLQRSLYYQPYRVHQLERLLGGASRLQLETKEHVAEVGEREWQGAQWNYVQTVWKAGGREFWFDPSTGVLVREKHDSLEDMSAFEYGDFVAVGGRFFPQSPRLFEFGKLVVEVRAEELSVISEPSPSLFRPPENAQSSPRCEQADPPKGLKKPEPTFPRRTGRSSFTGVTSAYVEVGPDGLVRYANILRTPGEDFTTAVQKVLPRWRFRPATCHGTPVEFSVFVYFTFQTIPAR